MRFFNSLAVEFRPVRLGNVGTNRVKGVFWVDHLGISSSLYLLLRIFRGTCKEVRYFHSSQLACRVVDFLQRIRILRQPWIAVDYSLGDMRSTNGCSLYYECIENVSTIGKKALDEIYAYSTLMCVLEKRFRKGKIRAFVQKSLAQAINDPIKFACVVRWYKQNSECLVEQSHVMLFSMCATNRFVRSYFQHDGLYLAEYPCLSRSNSLVAVIRGILLLIALLFRVRWWPEYSHKKQDGRPLVAVQVAGTLDFQKRTDFSWYPYSEIDPAQILMYFNRPDHPATPEMVALIERRGMRWVDLTKWKPTPLQWLRILQTCFRVISLVVCCLFRQQPARWWQLTILINLMRHVNFLEAFYRKYNVRVVLNFDETSPSMAAIAIAMDLVGGIYLGYHWSHFSTSDLSLCRPHQVYFAWGSHYVPLFVVKDQSEIDVLLLHGHMHSHFGSILPKVASDRHHGLAVAGARCILAIFDTSFSNDGPCSKNMILAFYKAFLMEVLQDGRVGLIIKPKNPDVWNRLPEIAPLVSQALLTNRCLILDDGTTAWEASLSVDIAVGIGVLGTNSAAVEAALTGTPAVHCDLLGHRANPFYEWGDGRVIFDDLGQLMETLRGYRNNPSCYPGLGDHSPVLSEIDPFQDGKSAYRVGSYIRWFLEEIDRTVDRNIALQRTNARYAVCFGAQNIFEFKV